MQTCSHCGPSGTDDSGSWSRVWLEFKTYRCTVYNFTQEGHWWPSGMMTHALGQEPGVQVQPVAMCFLIKYSISRYYLITLLPNISSSKM